MTQGKEWLQVICYKILLASRLTVRTWDEKVCTTPINWHSLSHDKSRPETRKPAQSELRIPAIDPKVDSHLQSGLLRCQRLCYFRRRLARSDTWSLITQLGCRDMIQSGQPRQPNQMNISKGFKLSMGHHGGRMAIDISSVFEMFC
jgi:hypothetical protein